MCWLAHCACEFAMCSSYCRRLNILLGHGIQSFGVGEAHMGENSTVPLVEARDLQKQYRATRAVRGISFKVSRGEVVGFLGPNGAGKSTTMKMLTGYLRPSAGSAYVGGVDVEKEPLAARRILGYLPESAPLYDEMMVVDFLHFIAELRGVEPNKRTQRLRDACERCGLMKVLGKDIGQLSKGFRQRVGLAQTLLHDPDLLILDEPTSGLDPNQIIEIRELIRDLGREKTVILSTHILPEVQATCGRIIIVNDGKLVVDDRPDVLAQGESGTVIRLVVKNRLGRVLNREQLHKVLSHVPGVHNVDPQDGEGGETVGFTLRATGTVDPREGIFDAAVSNDFVILDLHRERVSLEDTFRRLTRSSSGQGEAAHA